MHTKKSVKGKFFQKIQRGPSMTSVSKTFFVLVNPYPFNTVKRVWMDQIEKGYGLTKTSLIVHRQCLQTFYCPPKYRKLRCLLRVKGLAICFYLGWSGSILQFRQNIINIGSKSWLLTCSGIITLSLPSYTGSTLKRELNACNGYLSLLYYWKMLRSSKIFANIGHLQAT